MNDWINVENGLPAPGTLCLATIAPRAKGKPTVIVARYCKGFERNGPGCWLSCPGSWNVAVTHWMELPASAAGQPAGGEGGARG